MNGRTGVRLKQGNSDSRIDRCYPVLRGGVKAEEASECQLSGSSGRDASYRFAAPIQFKNRCYPVATYRQRFFTLAHNTIPHETADFP